MYGTARAELLRTCVASMRVQTLVACICRSACAVAWRRRLPPYLESPPVYDRPKVGRTQGALIQGKRHDGHCWSDPAWGEHGQF